MADMSGQSNGNVIVTRQQRLGGTAENQRTTITGLGIITTKPKFPQFARVAKRQESYFQQEVIWPSNIPVSVDALVAAGLVFTGVGDSVRCYHCGGGLRNWEPGDDPMVEHARWYPNCPHVILVKGNEYVNRIAELLPPAPDNTLQLIPDKILETSAAQAVIENGYSPENVKNAIYIYRCRYGLQPCEGGNCFLDFTGRDLCKILMEMEEEDDIESLVDENRRLKMNLSCKVCSAAMADIVFTPCGHMVCCGQCAPGIHVCFKCYKTVEGLVKALWNS